MSDPVLVAQSGDIATVTLNRPERLNALDLAMWQAMAEAMEKLAASDDGLRCVLLRGAGDKAFAAGADLAEFASARATPSDAERYGKIMDRALRSICDCPLPTIAMIQGACIGGGLQIAIVCDLRICGATSRFGAPLQKIGVVMPFPEIAYLVELEGARHAHRRRRSRREGSIGGGPAHFRGRAALPSLSQETDPPLPRSPAALP